MRHLTPDDLLSPSPPPVRLEGAHRTHAEYLLETVPQISISLTTILHELRPWLKARVHRGIALVPGDAKDWAAVELVAWLNDGAGSHPDRHWDVERNASIHLNPDHRVALLFNRRATTNSRAVIAIGIRVQSLLATPGRFAQGVDAEMERLRPAALRVPFNVCQRVVLAMSMDAAGASALLARGFETLATGVAEVTLHWRELGE